MRPGGGRDKGHAFERQLANDLFAETGIKFSRILNQSREAGLADLEAVDFPDFPLIIEAKRYAAGTHAKPAWWDQVCVAARNASKPGKTVYPCLIWKYDRLPVRCRLPIQAMVGLSCYTPSADKNEQYDWRYACDLDWETFVLVLREMIADAV